MLKVELHTKKEILKVNFQKYFCSGKISVVPHYCILMSTDKEPSSSLLMLFIVWFGGFFYPEGI